MARKDSEQSTNSAAERIQIRRAEIDDCRAIADVLRSSFAEFKALYTEAGFAATTPSTEQILVRMKEGPVWLALHNATIIGTVAAMKKDESVYVRGMAVLPSARGTGAGTRLLQEVERWALRQNTHRIYLSTTPFLDAAIRLYERSGFRRIADGPHDLFGTPLFTMEKLLSS